MYSTVASQKKKEEKMNLQENGPVNADDTDPVLVRSLGSLHVTTALTITAHSQTNTFCTHTLLNHSFAKFYITKKQQLANRSTLTFLFLHVSVQLA